MSKEFVSSLRIYLSLSSEEELEELTEEIAELLIQKGYNPDSESLDTVMAVVPDSEDVEAWANDLEDFSDWLTENAASIITPINPKSETNQNQ